MTFTANITVDIKSKYDPGDVVCFKLFSDEFYIGMILSCGPYTYYEDLRTKAKIKYRIITYNEENHIHTYDIEEKDIISSLRKEDFDCIEANYEKYKEEN